MHHHTHVTKSKKSALHRIKIVQGHLKAIEKMIEDDQYCVDVIHQSIAVQKALKKLDEIIMEDHLDSCVVEQIKEGDAEKTVTELKRLFEMM